MSAITAAQIARSKRKAARKRAKQHASLPWPAPLCVECGGMGELTTGAAICPHRRDLWPKRFYLCVCGAYVGCHPDTEIPLGTPAGPETRRARNEAHAAFDAIWKRKAIKEGCSYGRARAMGYAWLAKRLGISPDDCHMALMDKARAWEVVALCRPFARS